MNRSFWSAAVLIGLSVFLQGHKRPTDPMPPNDKERILIRLPNCPGASVIEWRGSANLESWTGPNRQTIETLDRLCSDIVLRLPKFAKSLGYTVTQEPWNFSIALMPFRSERDGTLPRNLNDHLGRFLYRPKNYDDGRVRFILGYSQFNTSTIYLRNDVLWLDEVNYEFYETLAHEMFHMFSYHHRIYYQHQSDKNQQDEVLARKFTAWLGL